MRNVVMLVAVSLLLTGCAGQLAINTGSIPVIEGNSGNREVAASNSNETWLIDGSQGPDAPNEPVMAQGGGLTIPSDVTQPGMFPGVNADNLDPQMLYEMGRQFMEGDGVEKNPDIAKHYLGLSKDLGNVEAKRVLAILSLRDNPQDATAIAELEEAALTSSKAKAQYGMMLANMTSPRLNNLPRGMALIHQAYSEGSHEAAYALYLMSKNKSALESADYLHVAAERGNPKAVAEMAHAQAYAPSKENSLKWVRAAMAKNDPQAMFDYANSLMIGRYAPTLDGYPQNREFEAYYWFSKSAALGYEPALTEVSNLQGVGVTMKKMQVELSSLDEALQLTSE